MQIKETIHQILNQFSTILSQLNDDEYTKELSILNKQTIGKHSRHIIEFFQELTKSNQIICYDNRSRDLSLENSISYTLNQIDILKDNIDDLDFNKQIKFQQLINQEILETESTIGREMIYSIDHCIHHFAIIKIALKSSFPSITIDENFGIAYSTLKFHSK